MTLIFRFDSKFGNSWPWISFCFLSFTYLSYFGTFFALLDTYSTVHVHKISTGENTRKKIEKKKKSKGSVISGRIIMHAEVLLNSVRVQIARSLFQ